MVAQCRLLDPHRVRPSPRTFAQSAPRANRNDRQSPSQSPWLIAPDASGASPKNLIQAPMRSSCGWEAELFLPLLPVNERFEKFVMPVPESGCWLWLGRVDPDSGYGQFSLNDRITRAHRAAWLLYRGDIPAGRLVLHRCDVRCCVNPNHLFLGSHKDNMRDCITKGRFRAGRGGGPKGSNVYPQTHCKRGHPFSGDNLYISPGSKRRFCRECHRITHPHLYPKWRDAQCQKSQIPEQK